MGIENQSIDFKFLFHFRLKMLFILKISSYSIYKTSYLLNKLGQHHKTKRFHSITIVWINENFQFQLLTTV
jgi:hypothetical protein